MPREAATRGIEERTLKLMSMVLEETMPGLEAERLALLSGPTFAREVARGLPTDVVVASTGMVAARKVQELVHSLTPWTYTSADPVGVQVGGAVKNEREYGVHEPRQVACERGAPRPGADDRESCQGARYSARAKRGEPPLRRASPAGSSDFTGRERHTAGAGRGERPGPVPGRARGAPECGRTRCAS